MKQPAVSVVLPVRNEVDTIDTAISSALAQEYAGPIQVVVADGASTDGTWELLQDLQRQNPRLEVVRNPAGVTPAGLNVAIRAAEGDIVVRLDGHAALPPGYVQRAVETMERVGADNVGGVQAATGRGRLQSAIALAMSSPMGVGDARFHYGGKPGPADTVYLGVFRRDVFDRVGYFDESLLRNQDYELNHRIRQAGGLVWFDPELRVEYRPRASLRALWRQYHQYGAWKREVVGRHPRSIRWRQVVPPLFVLALLSSIVLAATPLRPLSVVVPGTYAVALGATSIFELVRGRRGAALLPLVLPTMHIAWGMGFLIGPRNQGARER